MKKALGFAGETETREALVATIDHRRGQNGIGGPKKWPVSICDKIHARPRCHWPPRKRGPERGGGPGPRKPRAGGPVGGPHASSAIDPPRDSVTGPPGLASLLLLGPPLAGPPLAGTPLAGPPREKGGPFMLPKRKEPDFCLVLPVSALLARRSPYSRAAPCSTSTRGPASWKSRPS